MVEAAPGSALAGLRKAREKALAGLTLDLRVPGFEDPEVFVRYRPIKQADLDLAADRAEGLKVDAEITMNAVVLSHACLGVFAVDEAGEPVGLPDSWPRFDQVLAADLGLVDDGQQPTTVEIVRALYLTDGALIHTAKALDAWSAPAIQRREKSAGN